MLTYLHSDIQIILKTIRKFSLSFIFILRNYPIEFYFIITLNRFISYIFTFFLLTSYISCNEIMVVNYFNF